MVIPIITPSVPPITASPPEPKHTSDRSRSVSFGYLRRTRGVCARARPWNASCQPIPASALAWLSTARAATRLREWREGGTSERLRRNDLEVDGGQHQVDEEQQQERDHDGLV